MLKNVYVVSTGSYSDYRIDAIFSTKEKAEQYMATQRSLIKDDRGDYYNDVEEFPLDIPKKQWLTTMVLMDKNGNVLKIEMLGEFPLGFRTFNRDSNLVWVVTGHNEQRAIKVVNEKRAQILAHDVWGDNEKVKELFGTGATNG